MTFRFRSSGAFTYQTYTNPMFSSDKIACSGSLVRTNRGDIVTTDVIGETRSMTDTVVKNFRKLSQEGRVFFNYMSARRTTINPAIFSGGSLVFLGNYLQCSGGPDQYQSIYELPGSYGIQFVNSAFQLVNEQWYPPSLLPQGVIENVIDEANTRCLNQRGRPGFSILEDLAERRKTAQLAAGYGKQLWTSALNIEKAVYDRSVMKKVKALGGIASSAGSAYLMTRYGLLPVIGSVKSVLEAVKKQNKEAIRQTTRGKSQYDTFRTESSTLDCAGSHLTCNVTTMTTDDVVARAMSLDDWRAETTLERYGVDMKGLITLPWELMTLSFVADWFANIGELIGALVPSPHLNQLGGCIVLTRTYSVTQTLGGFSPVGIANVLSNASATKTGTLVEKTRYPGLRSPSFVFRPLSRANPVLDRNWLRFADAVVLSGQALQRASRRVG